MTQDPHSVQYDALVIGSGASGGWAAKKLSEAGLKVALMEAGRNITTEDFTEHMPPFKLDFRNLSPEIARTRPIQKMCYACMEYNYDWFVNDLENPYSHPEDKPFTWQRLRILGGRTLVWGRKSFRLSDLDFKAASHDGYDEDWPFSYEDMEPYYDEVERYVGISGMAEGHPALPDSRFLPPMPLTCGEQLLRERIKNRFGRTLTIGREARLTRNHNGRAACHYCGPCERGCMTFSYFSSPFTTVKDAIDSGNCTLFTNALVSQVNMDNQANRATGVTYINRITHKTYEVSARAVILCAQALESTRLLLNSSTRNYSTGLANSSGLLGKYLMDHVVGAGATGEMPQFDSKHLASDAQRHNGIYIIRYRNLKGQKQDSRFIRGYGFQGGAMPQFAFNAQGFGADYKNAVKTGRYGIRLTGFGESLARLDNYVEIDPKLNDAWGIPSLKIHMSHGSNEHAIMEDAAVGAAEMLEAAGVRNINMNSSVAMAGMAIHEVGTARMGQDPKKSILNEFNQTHDVQNLFVMDGACFVSSACQNPTLTIMAITARSSEHLIDRFRKNEV